eukprot:12717115-Alexandrium_andersonii.AAC.1
MELREWALALWAWRSWRCRGGAGSVWRSACAVAVCRGARRQRVLCAGSVSEALVGPERAGRWPVPWRKSTSTCSPRCAGSDAESTERSVLGGCLHAQGSWSWPRCTLSSAPSA